MDGEAFDRLSVAVHRLREQATRRNALRLLAGGAAVAATGLSIDDTNAKRRKKNKNKNKKRKKCRNNNWWNGWGGRCRKNKDCCYGKCRNGICWNTGGGGGGGGKKRCNGVRCPSGWKCCKRWQDGVKVCAPPGDPVCFDNNICYGGEPCGWNGPVRNCCSSGWKCCGNGRCCPDGWRCGDVACYANQDAEVGGESTESTPFVEAVPENEMDSAESE